MQSICWLAGDLGIADAGTLRRANSACSGCLSANDGSVLVGAGVSQSHRRELPAASVGHVRGALSEIAGKTGADGAPIDLREMYDGIGRNAESQVEVKQSGQEFSLEVPKNTILNQEHQMIDQTAVQQNDATALPHVWSMLVVCFQNSEWPTIVEVSKTVNDGPGTYTTHEPRMECTLFVRRHADGRTLVGYEATENAKHLCSLTLMVTPQTTWHAIGQISFCLLDAAREGHWDILIAKFKAQYKATNAGAMDAAKCASPIINSTKEPPRQELPFQPRPCVRELSSTSPVVPSNAARSIAPGRTVRK